MEYKVKINLLKDTHHFTLKVYNRWARMLTSKLQCHAHTKYISMITGAGKQKHAPNFHYPVCAHTKGSSDQSRDNDHEASNRVQGNKLM